MREGIDREHIFQLVRTAANDVFTTMLGLELEPLEAYVETAGLTSGCGVVSLIGFAGTWVGTGTFSCSPAKAGQLADALLGCEHAAVNEEVLDAVAEITNMILGNVKTELEGTLGPMLLSVPTVIYGRNFATRSLGRHEWCVVPFRNNGENIEVKVFLSPVQDAHLQRPGFERGYSVHV